MIQLSEPGPAQRLEVRELSLRLAGREVLRRVSFQLRAGEIASVIGANGAGKTSLLETVCGARRADAGAVHFAGAALGGLADRARVFSYLPDEAEPPAEVAVQTLVRLALRTGRLGEPVAEALLSTLGLRPLLRARAGTLSRGEKRRLGLFEALAAGRPVLVLDEPLGVFDPLQLLDALELLRERAAAGTILLLSVHQLADAEKLGGRVLILHEGRALAFGSLPELQAAAGLPGARLEEVFLALLKRSHAEA